MGQKQTGRDRVRHAGTEGQSIEAKGQRQRQRVKGKEADRHEQRGREAEA